jgi:hypothetical protein
MNYFTKTLNELRDEYMQAVNAMATDAAAINGDPHDFIEGAVTQSIWTQLVAHAKLVLLVSANCDVWRKSSCATDGHVQVTDQACKAMAEDVYSTLQKKGPK